MIPCSSPRNLDISALRSFVTVAELGGMTRAAERLNLTQSAVSMQLKRLETAFDQPLMQRHGRGVSLTSESEQLLSYGRRMVKLNDETWNRMMHEAFESRVSFGVPEDIVRPYVTGMLRDFVGAFPNYKAAYDAWKNAAQRTVDSAETRYFILHAHKLLDPSED